MTDYPGIDYGLGRSNVDANTGIRFGVIPANTVGEAWDEKSEPSYPNACPHCGQDLPEAFDREVATTYPCCDNPVEAGDADYQEPSAFVYKNAEYFAVQADETDIFIEQSPYFTYAQFCSPCAPGACYLLNPLNPLGAPKSNRAYCFGHDWFENGKAPYPVFNIATQQEVLP